MSNFKFTVLLSASVPLEKRSEKYQENYTKIKNAQIQIEEAVIGLARNIFQAGGRMVFGGHPSISPLVAMVALEFKLSAGTENLEARGKREKAIKIFQSKAYEKAIPKETTSLFELGHSEIVWTEAIDGEEFNSGIKGRSQCEKSLEFMRMKMIDENVDGLVCIGGMEGIELEFELFKNLKPNKPIFILKTTGGASKILAERYSKSNFIRILDEKEYSQIKTEKKETEFSGKFNIIPYSFITALIVQEIIDSKLY